MFVLKDIGYGKIPNGDGKAGQTKMSKNVSRNGSSGTASIKGLFCFFILQNGSRLHISLLLVSTLAGRAQSN